MMRERCSRRFDLFCLFTVPALLEESAAHVSEALYPSTVFIKQKTESHYAKNRTTYYG